MFFNESDKAEKVDFCPRRHQGLMPGQVDTPRGPVSGAHPPRDRVSKVSADVRLTEISLIPQTSS